MPKFKAVYLFDKIYDFEGIKVIEAKYIKDAVEKLKKAGRRGHLIDENYDTVEKPIYSPRRMHVFNSEKFSDIIGAQENEDSPDVVIDEDFTFEE